MTHIMVDLEELRYHRGENPFVSERTLRKAGVVTTKPAKSNEPVVEAPAPKVYTTVVGGGYFDSENGFELCNPRIGAPFYYYNYEHPPPFDTGTMEIEVVIPPEPVFTNAVHGMVPPAMPTLSSLTKMEPSGGKKPALVIKKVEKPVEAAPEPTGWNAIMAELEKRKNGMLKKVEPPAPKKVEPPKAAAGPKKKKDFKDIMEELAYKLAKMRGDVADDDGDDAADAKADASKVQFDKSTKEAEVKPESTPTTGLRKLNSKPDLSSLLAKIKPPPTTPSKAGTGPPSAAAGAGAPAAGVEGQIVGKPALTAAPASIPYPPLLPAASSPWPPVPVAAPPTPEPVKPVEPPPPPAVEVVEKQTVALPAGYYMPEVQKGQVMPGKYVYGGVVTQALYDSLIREIPQKKKKPPKKVHIVSAPSHHVNKLTIDDLPTPTDFQSSIDRLRKSQDMREERNRQARDLELRPYLSDSTKPIEPVLTPAAVTPKKGGSSGSNSNNSSAVNTPTQPRGFQSNVDKRMEGKNFTFRQSSDGRSAGNSSSSGFKSPAGGQPAVRKDFSRQDPMINWMSNLRFDNTHGSGISAPSSASKAGRSRGAHAHYHSGGGSSVGGSGYEKENLMRDQQDVTMLEDDLNSTGFDSIDVSYTTTSESQQYLHDSINGGVNGRTPVIPQAPKLRIDDVVSRRQSLHASRQRDEQLRQQYEDERVKMIKARLRQKAVQAAQEAGVYKPATRYHQHQRMIERYSGRSDSGINLEELTRRSFQEYSSHHMNVAEVRRRGGGATHSSVNASSEFFLPTDLDYYYRERPDQQYSF